VSILDTNIEFLKGVGPKRSLLLNQELKIFSFFDLLNFFPFRYVDRSKFYSIRQITVFDVEIQVIGLVKNMQIIGVGKKKRLVVNFVDKTGLISLIFFRRITWIQKNIKIGGRYLIFGRPNKYHDSISFVHPEMELITSSTTNISYSLYPVYHSSEKLNNVGLNSKGLSKLIISLLKEVKQVIYENLSKDIIFKYNFIDRYYAFQNVHFPASPQLLNESTSRLKYEELFFLQIALLKQKIIKKKKSKSFVFTKVGPKFNDFYNKHLNFELTTAQKRVMKEIRFDFATGFQMNRLLQGDVGSGKTIIAIMSILLAHDNGFQSCLMAPTDILSNQHFNSILEFADDINIRIALLTGKIKAQEKKKILFDLKNNNIDLVIGTHALIQDDVFFNNLGLVIIDEQHKFGVSQRAKLWSSSNIVPHVLVMTATPIPRTLAMTAYGDLDVSVIDELPPNRKDIVTYHKFDSELETIYQFLYQELKKDKQVYIVFPLIEESKVLDYKNLLTGYEQIKDRFSDLGFNISIMHGRLKKEDKELEMAKFLNHETHIMVATTVIEVGVNVPNATIMVIQNAEKFGLSQLHQLRGRVGRGSDKSFCFLITSHKLTSDAKVRLKAMVESSDGFKIAEIDLKLRGPGDILGTRQSGLVNLKISNLVNDHDVLYRAREDAKNLLKKDSELVSPANLAIKKFFIKYHAKLLKWGSVA
tara:strand:+ start:12192 stop:14291 length:2100 start_codon:yes stop_codon:yes gene_type:complete